MHPAMNGMFASAGRRTPQSAAGNGTHTRLRVAARTRRGAESLGVDNPSRSRPPGRGRHGQTNAWRGVLHGPCRGCPTSTNGASQWDKKRSRGEPSTVEDGETVLLDGGSTTYEVARLLVGRPLQIVTNSLPVANLFASDMQTSDLVLSGGYVYPRTGVALGPTPTKCWPIRRATHDLSVAGHQRTRASSTTTCCWWKPNGP